MCEHIPCWGETNSSLPTACVGVCAIFPQELRSTMKQCVIMFSLAPHRSPCLSLLVFVCVRAISPSSDPGLSRDAGPGARGVCQPPLPRRRHPESQTPLAEERHGPAAQILQTALSHRWGVFKCCRQRKRFSRYCLSHLIGAVLQTNSTAARQHCRDLFLKPRQCRNNKSLKFKLVLAPFFSSFYWKTLAGSIILSCFPFICIPYEDDETEIAVTLLSYLHSFAPQTK